MLYSMILSDVQVILKLKLAVMGHFKSRNEEIRNRNEEMGNKKK